MDFLIGFFAGLFASPWALGGLLLCTFFFDREETYFAVFFFILALISAKLFFGWESFSFWYLLPYPFMGFFWSLWRYRKFVFKEHIKNQGLKKEDTFNRPLTDEDFAEKVSVEHNVDKIVYWILLWPVNMFMHLTQDLWDMLSLFVRTKLKGVYNSIRDGAIKSGS